MKSPPHPRAEPKLRLLAQRLRAALVTRYLRSQSQIHSLTTDQGAAVQQMSFIVPIRDAPEETRKCLESLERFAAGAQVILIDDQSEDPRTVQIIREYGMRNHWTTLRNESAKGHSQASTQGVAVADRSILCLLNSDTVVTPYSWKAIGDAFALDPNIAIAGPSTSETHGPQKLRVPHQCKRRWETNDIATYGRQVWRKHRGEAPVDLEFIGGFAFFIRRSAWDTLGGFDPNLPDYGNENDLCARALSRGMRCVWTQASYIHHYGGTSYVPRLGSWEVLLQKCQEANRYLQAKRQASQG